MNSTQTYNHFVLSKHSVHIFPAAIISILIIFATWYINRLLQKAILKKGKILALEEKLVKAIQDLVHIFIYSVGATLFLENLHIQMSALFGTLGVLAIGIGFALQKALANMTSGMFLLYYKPFFIGDYIISQKPKFEGKIIDINLRLTTLEYKGNLVLVPNHTLYAAVVTVKKQDKA
ncbi:MAG: mechanosensitive ion channel [Candidatus Chromulinivorax sp.]|nr:mechanosensitive ion channel [Candidatus Chromulinivorax sp.]